MQAPDDCVIAAVKRDALGDHQGVLLDTCPISVAKLRAGDGTRHPGRRVTDNSLDRARFAINTLSVIPTAGSV
jgi:hypothetical protein